MMTPASPGSADDNTVGSTTSVESSPSRAYLRVSDQLWFIQLNLQHCKAATATLCKHLAGSDKVVAMVQEPWINKDRILGFGTSKALLHRGSNETGPRTCILTKGVTAFSLPQFGDKDITTICLTHKGRGREVQIIVASIYMPSETDPPSAKMELLYEYCRKKNLSLIIASDTNSHHPLWGCDIANHRGNCLCELLATTDLEVVNVGCTPTYSAGNVSSIIDVTLVRRALCQDIRHWKVSDADTMSDHRQIEFSLMSDRLAPTRRRNIMRTDWDTYETELCSSVGVWIGRVRTPDDLEYELTKLNSAILDAYYKACPERRISGRKKVPWWNQELKILRKAANKAFHQAYKSKLEQDWQAHRAARRVFKKELRRSKRESWQHFCAKTEDMSVISRVYKLLDKANTAPLGMLKLPSGQWTNTLEEAYKHLLETHFPGCQLVSNGSNGSTSEPFLSAGKKWVPNTNWHVASTVITPDRIRWAIKTMAPFKSPGIDGIYPILLQKGLQHLLDPLCDIYRASLALGYIPQIWRT